MHDIDYLQLVRRAQLGDSESMNLLSEKVKGWLCAYIYRITLDFDLTDDIIQETLLEMVTAIKSLKDVRRFKSWLYRIASTKIKKHFRICGNKRIASKAVHDTDRLLQYASKTPDAMGQLIKKELSQAVMKAMSRLKFRHRNVLILRCFEQMPYPEIAYTLGCSSIQAQLLFFRAKQSLKKQLLNRGYRKEHIFASLGIFGALTAMPFKSASASVVPASMKVGTLASAVGVLTTKIGIITGIVAAAAVITISSSIAPDRLEGNKFNIINQEKYERTSLKYPSAIHSKYNSGGDWKKVIAHQFPKSISIEEWLTGLPEAYNTAVVVPQDSWIEMRFPSAIVDAPGNDIVIIEKCRYGEQAEVFITDCNSNEVNIGTLVVPKTFVHSNTIFAYDISELDLPFVPYGIRILTTNPGEKEFEGPLHGLDLVSVQANVSD